MTKFPVVPYCGGMSSNLPEDSWERVGLTVRTIREMRGLKADELACSVGISRPYLANIEAGRKPLTPILLAKLAAQLHVSQMAILNDTSELTKAAS